MATQPLHPTHQPVTLPGDMDPRDLFRLMSCFDPRQLAGFVDVAIGLIDLSEGDPDLEDNADREASDGDERTRRNIALAAEIVPPGRQGAIGPDRNVVAPACADGPEFACGHIALVVGIGAPGSEGAV